MSRTIIYVILPIMALVLLFISSSHASAYHVSFQSINSTLGINQYAFFNVSAYFGQNVSYSIFLNNSKIYSGTIPADFSGYKIIKYNITNLRYGTYRAYATFSTLTVRVNSSNNITIMPKPSLSFGNYSNVTAIYNNSARINIDLINSGNTPLNITWALPIFRGISMSISSLKETFPLSAGESYSIPINLTLSGNYTKTLNFSFDASFNGTIMVKNYVTTLFKPYINLSFYNTSLKTNNATSSSWTVYLSNKDNTPVMVTFEFMLYINKSELYYNKTLLISPTTTQITFPIPKSDVLGVKVFYPSSNSSEVSQQIFSSPVPGQPNSIVSAVYGNISYIALTVIVIVLLVVLNRKLSSKGRGKK